MESTIETSVLSHLTQFPELVRVGRGIERTVPQGKTKLTFRDSPVCSEAHLPCAIAEIETVFTGQSVNLNEKALSELNRRTVWGSFFETDGLLRLRLSCSIYRDEPASGWISSLLIKALAEQLAIGFGNIESYRSPSHLPLNRANLEFARSWAEPLEQHRFDKAAEHFSAQGWVSTAADSSLTLEVPMGSGAASRMIEEAAETALLRVDVAVPHPLAGVGYFGSIALPIDPTPDKIPQICCRLNALEHQLGDFPPRFGAWGIRSVASELVYTVFLPTTRVDPVTPQNIMAWLIRRALWLRNELWEPTHGINLGIHGHD